MTGWILVICGFCVVVYYYMFSDALVRVLQDDLAPKTGSLYERCVLRLAGWLKK